MKRYLILWAKKENFKKKLFRNSIFLRTFCFMAVISVFRLRVMLKKDLS